MALNGAAADSLDGQAVSISASSRDKLTLYALSGGSGELDAAKRTVGGRKLSDAVLLFDGGVGTTLLVTAMALAMDNDMTMVCFGLDEENSIVRVVRGEQIGTTVKNKF